MESLERLRKAKAWMTLRLAMVRSQVELILLATWVEVPPPWPAFSKPRLANRAAVNGFAPAHPPRTRAIVNHVRPDLTLMNASPLRVPVRQVAALGPQELI